MQLLYIYIHSFRNLKDSELCFSPSLDVRYEFDEKRLAFRKNPEVPEFAAKLYEPHIKSVHGIVGRNAVGKTNLADLISMPSALRMQVSSDAYFLLYASDLTENARYYIEICDDNNRLFPSLKTEEGREQWRTGWIRLIDGVPVWDEKQERFRTSVISLRESINSEVYVTEEGENQSQEKYLQVYDNRQRIVGTYTCGSIANQFTSFQFLHKVSHLFADVHNDYQNAPSFDDKEYILSLKVSDKWKEQASCFPEIEKSGLDGQKRFLLKCLCLFIQQHILINERNIDNWMREEIYDSQKEEKKQIDFRRLLDKADSQVDQMELLRMVKNYVLQRIPAVFYLQRDEEYRKAAQEFAAFLDNLSLVLAEPDISISEDGSLFCVTTRGSGRNNRRLRTFLENKIICERGYFQVFWKHISDGEKHFLEGYASLYRLLDIIGVVDKTYHSENSPKNVLLLIDEPELHSHPELARCFLYFLTKWIEEVNQENEELYYQLVVFTHSPFLLSDIDKKHVFHLIRKRDGVVTIEHPQKETFAANIHDVLNDSVFLECSVGAVAYERLRALIVGPEEGNSFLFETEEEQEYLISMIGEPILRDAFQQALRRKKIKS